MAAGFVATVSKVHGGSLLSFKAKTLANALTLTQTVSPIQVKGYSKTADNLLNSTSSLHSKHYIHLITHRLHLPTTWGSGLVQFSPLYLVLYKNMTFFFT